MGNTHQSETKNTTSPITNSKSSPIKISSTRPPTFNVEALINAQKAALSSSLLQQQQFEQQQAKALTASGPSCSKPLPETPTRSRHDSGSTDSGGDALKQMLVRGKECTPSRLPLTLFKRLFQQRRRMSSCPNCP